MLVPKWIRQLSMTTISLPRRALLDICEEYLSCHGALNHHRCRHFIVPQGSHERDSIPRSKRNGADHSDATRRPSSQPCQVGAHCSLIDKYQPSGIKQPLLSYPTPTRACDICSLPLGGLEAFF